jgi:hypothetical protein
MNAIFEGRPSDSPYIDTVWRGHILHDYAPVCPADTCWNLLFMRRGRHWVVTAEGATTHYVPKTQPDDTEFLVIKFRLGIYMPHLSADQLVNRDALLPNGGDQSFWLKSSAWQYPSYENAEVFVKRLFREGVLAQEPAVTSQAPAEVSSRTIRRRYLRATGLTPRLIHQISRAQTAARMLAEGTPILDTAYQAGYADQPHLTRAMRRFIGFTPAQLLGSSLKEKAVPANA